MAKYIEREALLTFAHNHKGGMVDCNDIARFPIADVVEAVRCKDCKHWRPTGSEAGDSLESMEPIGGCEYVSYCRRASGFCSYGEERK